MNNKTRICLMIIIFIVLMGSCRTAEFGFKVVDISGMVYDFSNRPVAHFEVVLDRKFSRKYKGSTDINGRFTLFKVPVGIYTLIGSKKGYEHYFDELNIKQKGQIIYIRIPSQNQLLNMVDEALVANDFTLAEETAERAFRIDNNNIEMLFYCATVAFRQNQFDKAISFLEKAKALGSKDFYVEKFLTSLKEIQHEN